MPAFSPAPPASVQQRFSDHARALAVRFEESSNFRELCRDFDEVVSILASTEPANAMAAELKRLAEELQEEIRTEIDSLTGD